MKLDNTVESTGEKKSKSSFRLIDLKKVRGKFVIAAKPNKRTYNVYQNQYL